MSGNELQGSNDLTLDAATNDLVLSVAGDVALEGTTAELPIFLRGAREVTIHSTRNAHLQNTEVSASQQATIKAAKELYVDNMRFNAELPKIVMEATTIRLSNVTFPAWRRSTVEQPQGSHRRPLSEFRYQRVRSPTVGAGQLPAERKVRRQSPARSPELRLIRREYQHWQAEVGITLLGVGLSGSNAFRYLLLPFLKSLRENRESRQGFPF